MATEAYVEIMTTLEQFENPIMAKRADGSDYPIELMHIPKWGVTVLHALAEVLYDDDVDYSKEGCTCE